MNEIVYEIEKAENSEERMKAYAEKIQAMSEKKNENVAEEK